MGCSIIVEMLPSVANFAIGLYNADDYYSKECLWYNEVKLNDETKKWLIDSNPPEVVSKDQSLISATAFAPTYTAPFLPTYVAILNYL